MKKKKGISHSFVDTDHSVGYENRSLLRTILNPLIIPLLNLLPASSRTLIRKSHKSVDEIVTNATTHAALEVLYKKGLSEQRQNIYNRLIHSFWFNTDNSIGVRNRLKLVKREVKGILNDLQKRTSDISLMSIASGSARAIIESIEETELKDGMAITTTFLDKNEKALAYSRRLLEEKNLHTSHFLKPKWIADTVGHYLLDCAFDYDIIEMVGLLDYFDDEKAVDIFRKIRDVVRPGGFFITANINHNKEKKFVTKVVGWSMIYRSAEDVRDLLVKAGFDLEKMRIFYEPLKIHSVIVAQK